MRSAPIDPTGRDPLIDSDARRLELADFLRSRRARLCPEDIGLPAGWRRRTPGLRREEVAELAGVGLTWYTWLEQGRSIRASGDVVEAIGRALRLNPDERAHLHTLAGTTDARHVHGVEAVPAPIKGILDALHPCPALLVNERLDVLAWNRAEAALMGDFARFEPHQRNMLWLVFTDPSFRALMIDFEQDAPVMVARFRAAMGRHIGERSWSSLVAGLGEASPLFAEIWDRHDVMGPSSKVKRYAHPVVGFMTLAYTTLRMAEMPGCEIHVSTPVDEASRIRMERLTAQTPSPEPAPEDPLAG